MIKKIIFCCAFHFKVCFRVLNRLPSWLLFVNKCGDIPNDSVMSELSKFITSRLVCIKICFLLYIINKLVT